MFCVIISCKWVQLIFRCARQARNYGNSLETPAVVPDVVFVGSNGYSTSPRAPSGACWRRGKEPFRTQGCRRGLNKCRSYCSPETTATPSSSSPPAQTQILSHLRFATRGQSARLHFSLGSRAGLVRSRSCRGTFQSGSCRGDPRLSAADAR